MRNEVLFSNIDRQAVSRESEKQAVEHRIGIIGVGNMGYATVRGLITQGDSIESLYVSNRGKDDTRRKLGQFVDSERLIITEDNAELARLCNIIILAIKPKDIGEELEHLVQEGVLDSSKLLVSLAAGKSTGAIKEYVSNEHQPVIRIMPNVSIAEGEGTMSCFATDEVTEGQQRFVKKLLSPLGSVVFIDDEEQMHALTILGGTWPAIDNLIDELKITILMEEYGIAKEIAEIIVRQTTVGSGARMKAHFEKSLTDQRREITSPGGTTAATVEFLEENDRLKLLLSGAIRKGVARSKELG